MTEQFEGTVLISFEAPNLESARLYMKEVSNRVMALDMTDGITMKLAHSGTLLRDKPSELLRQIEYEVI